MPARPGPLLRRRCTVLAAIAATAATPMAVTTAPWGSDAAAASAPAPRTTVAVDGATVGPPRAAPRDARTAAPTGPTTGRGGRTALRRAPGTPPAGGRPRHRGAPARRAVARPAERCARRGARTVGRGVDARLFTLDWGGDDLYGPNRSVYACLLGRAPRLLWWMESGAQPTFAPVRFAGGIVGFGLSVADAMCLKVLGAPECTERTVASYDLRTGRRRLEARVARDPAALAVGARGWLLWATPAAGAAPGDALELWGLARDDDGRAIPRLLDRGTGISGLRVWQDRAAWTRDGVVHEASLR
ncbi:hypothetical protein SK069_12015 [Patulibacter brassicae]|uniref:Uncharacterized protein n=1 Tax=Patulibacter brassicae TaxID=1705717 RepID=A0ABU4VN05_9ACTN|nr:hypothetical protein [Patulibacter brassicae]MDX8152326.1 hypothetical protein [Patulibacter brassicae]